MKTAVAAAGKWHGILLNFGLTEEQLRLKKGQPCPACEGTDRYAYLSNDNGGYNCRMCGGGDGFNLIEKVTGKGFKEISREIDKMLNNTDIPSAQEPPKPDPKIRIKALAERLTPPGKAVQRYLSKRGIYGNPIVKECDMLAYYDSDGRHQGDYPAMVAAITSPQGKIISMHCTYLDEEGNKANVENPKKTLPAITSLKGSAIRLTPLKKHIGIAEGIETACAVMSIFQVPCWSVRCTSGVESFEPPEGVEAVSIYADNDKSFAGQKSAYTLANKLAVKGVKCRVIVPDEIGDFADLLIDRDGNKQK